MHIAVRMALDLRRLSLWAAVLGGAASIGFAAETPVDKSITVYHWWTSPSESAAFAALVKAFNHRYPEVDVQTGRLVGGRSVRDQFPTIQRLVAEKHSPDAVQANAGYAAQVFYDAQLLGPIDDLWASEKLETVIPPLIRDLNKFEGHYYSVPVNVHRTNVVWYNKTLLDKYKIDPTTLTTWDAFFKAAETLRAAGIQSPIQMGQTWTAGHAFECVMASLGVDTYEQWINGSITRRDDPRLIKAWTIFQRYLTYTNKDNADVPWDAAIKRVMKGEGAFCIMGDWANGEFQVAGLKYGKDYGTFVVPDTQGLYGVVVDVFLHPRGIADDAGSRRWLSLAASRDGQDAFNPLKGSVPARTDADITKYDAYQRSALQDLKTARMYPNRASAVPEALNRQLYATVAAFGFDPDVEKAVRATADADAAAKLSAVGKSRRVWSLK